MVTWKRISNIIKCGLGPDARRKKEADKAKVRLEKFWEGERWRRDAGLARRDHGSSYEEYLSHQASKSDEIVDRLRETEDEDYAGFLRRFKTCEPLSEARSVLCLGAALVDFPPTELKAREIRARSRRRRATEKVGAKSPYKPDGVARDHFNRVRRPACSPALSFDLGPPSEEWHCRSPAARSRSP